MQMQWARTIAKQCTDYRKMTIEESRMEFELRINLKNQEQKKKNRKSEDMIDGTMIINMNAKHKSKC